MAYLQQRIMTKGNKIEPPVRSRNKNGTVVGGDGKYVLIGGAVKQFGEHILASL